MVTGCRISIKSEEITRRQINKTIQNLVDGDEIKKKSPGLKASEMEMTNDYGKKGSANGNRMWDGIKGLRKINVDGSHGTAVNTYSRPTSRLPVRISKNAVARRDTNDEAKSHVE